MNFILIPLMILTFANSVFGEVLTHEINPSGGQPNTPKSTGTQHYVAEPSNPNSCHEAMLAQQASRINFLGTAGVVTDAVSKMYDGAKNEKDVNKYYRFQIGPLINELTIKDATLARYPRECSEQEKIAMNDSVSHDKRVAQLQRVFHQEQLSGVKTILGKEITGYFRGVLEGKLGPEQQTDGISTISNQCRGALLKNAGALLMEEIALEFIDRIDRIAAGDPAFSPEALGMVPHASRANMAGNSIDNPNVPPTLSDSLQAIFPKECTKENRIAYLRNYTARNFAEVFNGNRGLKRLHMDKEVRDRISMEVNTPENFDPPIDKALRFSRSW